MFFFKFLIAVMLVVPAVFSWRLASQSTSNAPFTTTTDMEETGVICLQVADPYPPLSMFLDWIPEMVRESPDWKVELLMRLHFLKYFLYLAIFLVNERLVDFHEQRSTLRLFGPAYSSDNSGDGPNLPLVGTGQSKKARIRAQAEKLAADIVARTAAESAAKASADAAFKAAAEVAAKEAAELASLKYPYSTTFQSAQNLSVLPLFSQLEFTAWKRKFEQLSLDEVHLLVTGTETRPTLDTCRGSAAVLERFTQDYDKRNRWLYRQLYHCLVNSPKDASAVSYAEGTGGDGVLLWQQLNAVFNKRTVQNKINAVVTAFAIKQEPSEPIIQYKQRLTDAFTRIKELEVKLPELAAVLFLNNLLPSFEIFKNHIRLEEKEEEMDISKLFDRAVQWQQSSLIPFEDVSGKAHMAVESALMSQLAEVQAQLAALSNAQQRGQKRAFPKETSTSPPPRQRLRDDPHPVQIICHNCGKPGHKSPQCKQPRKLGPRKVQFQAKMAMSATSSTMDSTSNKFFADSGASSHMVANIPQSAFKDFTPLRVPVNTASGEIYSLGIGSLGILTDVLLLPKLSANLFSISHACAKGYSVLFTAESVKILMADQVTTFGTPVLEGPCREGMYDLEIPMEMADHKAFVADVSPPNSFTKWHARLGHCSKSVLKAMLNHGSVHGLQFTKDEARRHACKMCTACALGKMPMLPVRRHPINVVTSTLSSSTSSSKSISPARLVLMDILVSPVQSMGGNSYALVIMDVDTRYTWIYFQKSKGEVETLENIKVWTKTVKRDGIKLSAYATVRSDNGGEFTNAALTAYLLDCGIRKETCPPYAHVHMVERALRTIQDSARAMLFHCGMSAYYWAEAASVAVYTFNRTVNKNSMYSTPYELYYNSKPSVAHLRAFGSYCFARHYPHQLKKWDHRSVKCRLLGYGDESHSPKTWKLLELSSRRIIFSSNVIFDESMTNPDKCPVEDVEQLFAHDPEEQADQPPLPPPAADLSEAPLRQRLIAELEAAPVSSRLRHHSFLAQVLSARAKHTFEKLEPATIKQALASTDKDKWLEAISAENNSLSKNLTFTVMPKPSRCFALGLKWVFKVKTDSDGNIQRYKARCTALGNLQREGIDFDETFSPVVRYSTLRALLAMSAQKGMVVHNMDVDTAFLYGKLPEDDDPVYVKVPYGYPIPKKYSHYSEEDLVCRVHKSIYGLKQSPRLWNLTIDDFMRSKGFKRSESDHCLYSRLNNGEELYVALYVDDLIISGSKLSTVERFKSQLKQRFNMKDLGPLTSCLGMEIKQDPTNGTITVSQSKYIGEILRRFGMSDKMSRSSPVPMEPGLKLFACKDAATSNYPYREVVGSLMYLMTSTRPDISFAVGKLSRYLNSHGPDHHAAAQQVLRYLHGTPNVGLTFRKSADSPSLLCYSDSDWASDVETRRSTTGYIFILAGAPISWCSKLQPTVALSSTEAEYMALSATTQEAISIRNLCSDLNIISPGPITIFGDNQGSIAMAKNPVNHKASKHISIRHHFVRERVDSKEVQLQYTPTASMLADFLTKALAKVSFLRIRDSAMGLRRSL